jgi:hypothetical protein
MACDWSADIATDADAVSTHVFADLKMEAPKIAHLGQRRSSLARYPHEYRLAPRCPTCAAY